MSIVDLQRGAAMNYLCSTSKRSRRTTPIHSRLPLKKRHLPTTSEVIASGAPFITTPPTAPPDDDEADMDAPVDFSLPTRARAVKCHLGAHPSERLGITNGTAFHHSDTDSEQCSNSSNASQVSPPTSHEPLDLTTTTGDDGYVTIKTEPPPAVSNQVSACAASSQAIGVGDPTKHYAALLAELLLTQMRQQALAGLPLLSGGGCPSYPPLLNPAAQLFRISPQAVSTLATGGLPIGAQGCPTRIPGSTTAGVIGDSPPTASTSSQSEIRNRQQPICTTDDSDPEPIAPTAIPYVINPATGNKVRRNYKNTTKARRQEANARERNRVHTIGASFDALRHLVPCAPPGGTCQGAAAPGEQKLSKLSVLRIACRYIMLLAAMNGLDYSSDRCAYSVEECTEMLDDTIAAETKLKRPPGGAGADKV